MVNSSNENEGAQTFVPKEKDVPSGISAACQYPVGTDITGRSPREKSVPRRKT
jgi:hypothetical protein